MPVGSQESEEENQDLNDEESVEFSNEDYGDFEIPEEEFDIMEEKPAHSALLEDQHRKKDFAKHTWAKTEQGGEPENMDDTTTGDGKTEENENINMDDTTTGDGKMEDEFSQKNEPRRKNFVETHWPSESELENGDYFNSPDLAEEILISLLTNN